MPSAETSTPVINRVAPRGKTFAAVPSIVTSDLQDLYSFLEQRPKWELRVQWLLGTQASQPSHSVRVFFILGWCGLSRHGPHKPVVEETECCVMKIT